MSMPSRQLVIIAIVGVLMLGLSASAWRNYHIRDLFWVAEVSMVVVLAYALYLVMIA